MAACAPLGPAAVDTSADQAALHAIDKAHVDAFNSGDVEAIVAAYADDASGMPSIVGHEEIHKYFTDSIASAKAAGLTESLGEYRAGVSGDLDGKWLNIRDTWNDDAPPAPAALAPK